MKLFFQHQYAVKELNVNQLQWRKQGSWTDFYCHLTISYKQIEFKHHMVGD